MASEGFPSSRWYVTDLNLSLQFHHHGLVIIAVVIVSIILFISFFFAISFVSAVKWVQLMEVEAPALGLLQLRLQYKPGIRDSMRPPLTVCPFSCTARCPVRKQLFKKMSALFVCVRLKKMRWLRSFQNVCICTILNVLINGFKIVQYVLFAVPHFILLLLWK